MVILGLTNINSLNQAATLLVDGKIKSWSEEERFSRKKYSQGSGGIYPPHQTVSWVLDREGMTLNDVDYIAIGHSSMIDVSKFWSKKSFHKNIGLERVDKWSDRYLVNQQNNMLLFTAELAERSDEKINHILSKIVYQDHHKCHVASTVIPSGFEHTNFITLDGDGGETAGYYGFFDGVELEYLSYHHPLGSIGELYSDITEKLGWMRHQHEGKTMGLACYGDFDKALLNPIYTENSEGFLLSNNKEMTTWMEDNHPDVLKELFLKHETKKARDLAASIQHVQEKLVMYNYHRLQQLHPSDNLCVAGGSMLNCTANGKLAKETNLYVQPGTHDSGTALGAAILTHKQFTGEWPQIRQHTAYYGRQFTHYDFETHISQNDEFKDKFHFEKVDVSEVLANLIHEDKVVAYFEGRSEVGPRALCHRSILANPTKKENLDRLNKIKKREWWRPLAPTIAEEYISEITHLNQTSPFMLIATKVRREWRDKIPAVTHVDNSCRPQTVNESQNYLIYKSLIKFKELSGVPVFMNTSFNIQEPLVDSPEDALRTFLKSDGIDYLLAEGLLISKK
tara:strand:- start:1112 stop:2809 length:1698 start_codon:yes stop_codon:yes gene_type:complete